MTYTYGKRDRYIGNVNKREVHDTENEQPNCQLSEIKDRRIYATLDEARADLDYDNCHWCLGSSTR